MGPKLIVLVFFLWSPYPPEWISLVPLPECWFCWVEVLLLSLPLTHDVRGQFSIVHSGRDSMYGVLSVLVTCETLTMSSVTLARLLL